jgi:hypothetical protein
LLGGALGVKALLGLAQALAQLARGPKLGRQLIAARVTEQLVLGRVDLGGLLEDLPLNSSLSR